MLRLASPRFLQRVAAAALVALLSCSGSSVAQTTPDARTFGHGTHTLRGTRPLLVILMNFPDSRFTADHTAAFYDRLIFGPADPNVNAYYREVSRGIFQFNRAGIVGPFTYPRDVLGLTGSDGANRLRSTVVRLAAQEGHVDFRRFDRNDDGVVSVNELAILIINADPIDQSAEMFGDGGQSSHIRAGRLCSCGIASLSTGLNSLIDLALSEYTVRIRTMVSVAGQSTSLMTVAHELGHQTFDMIDLYGAGDRSPHMSLACSTIFGRLDDRRSFHLDSWHKMRAGWTAPRIFSLQRDARSVPLAQATSRAPVPEAEQPILLYDPSRGTNEFFLLEYRVRLRADRDEVDLTDPFLGYDAEASATGERGVAIWYVQLRDRENLARLGTRISAGNNERLDSRTAGDDVLAADGRSIEVGPNQRLDSMPARDDALETDNAVFTYGAPQPWQPVAWARGGNGLWRSEDGAIPLTWFDGTPSGAVLRVGPIGSASTGVNVEWTVGDASSAVAPELTAVRAEAGPPGYLMTLEGRFALNRGSHMVELVNTRETRPLEIASWTSTRVTARVPYDTPVARYLVRVATDSARTRVSRMLPFEVTAPTERTPEEPGDTLLLVRWRDAQHDDRFATVARPAAEFDFYAREREEGYVFNPRGRQPSGTLPLHRWSHPLTKDDFLTTDPAWVGRASDSRDGYRYIGVEAYIYDPQTGPRPGRAPLYSWRNNLRSDRFETSDPAWSGRPGDHRGGYAFVRIEGYVLTQPGIDTEREIPPLAVLPPVTGRPNLIVPNRPGNSSDGAVPGFNGGAAENRLPPSTPGVPAQPSGGMSIPNQPTPQPALPRPALNIPGSRLIPGLRKPSASSTPNMTPQPAVVPSGVVPMPTVTPATRRATHVLRHNSEFYAASPAQGRSPDGVLPAKASVALLQTFGSYALVRVVDARLKEQNLYVPLSALDPLK